MGGKGVEPARATYPYSFPRGKKRWSLPRPLNYPCRPFYRREKHTCFLLSYKVRVRTVSVRRSSTLYNLHTSPTREWGLEGFVRGEPSLSAGASPFGPRPCGARAQRGSASAVFISRSRATLPLRALGMFVSFFSSFTYRSREGVRGIRDTRVFCFTPWETEGRGGGRGAFGRITGEKGRGSRGRLFHADLA